MRIDAKSEAARLNNVRATRTKAQQDEAALGGAKRLTDILAQLPEVRAEKVAQARKWVSDFAYPSDAMLGKVADILAGNIRQ